MDSTVAGRYSLTLATILLITGLIAGSCVDRTDAEPVGEAASPTVSTAASSTDLSHDRTTDRRMAGSSVEVSADSAHRRDRQVEGVPATAYEVLAAIQRNRGKPPPGYVGGRTFMNRERRLPSGRYREYDIYPLVSGGNRGAERLVVEQQSGKAYYTGDHYRTFIPMN